MGPIGVQEMIAIFVIALVLFGPKKLPELGRMLGKALSEFRRAKNELKATFETHLNELEREARVQTPTAAPAAPDYSPTPYSYPYEDGQYDSSYQPYAASHDTYQTHETDTSQPSTASATAVPDAEAHRDLPSLQNAPVSGTVPRTNGVQSLETAAEAAKEEHPV